MEGSLQVWLTKLALWGGILTLVCFMVCGIRSERMEDERIEYVRREENLAMRIRDAWTGSVERAGPAIYVNEIYVEERFKNASELFRPDGMKGGYYRKYELIHVQEENDGVRYYHLRDCDRIDRRKEKEAYYRMEECAGDGAYPCPVCISGD